MEEHLGRRDRKKIASRRSLRSAAVRLVAERGLKHVTVEEIAEAADVSARTFFNYFSSKEEAIVGHDPEQAAELRQALLARPAEEPPLIAVRHVLVDLAAPLAERQEDWLLHMRVVRQEPSLLPSLLASFAAHERNLIEALAERTGTDPDRDLYPALVAAASMAAFRVAMTHWRHWEGKRSLARLVESAFAQFAAGLPEPAPVSSAPRRAPGPAGIDGSLGNSGAPVPRSKAAAGVGR
ncbi:MAG: TetR family transcriptional regulator [Candidatus Dormiibacterota bacterium]